ncbi:unnamed protein product [Echinostoma caproni]|uniref:FAD-binding FR-type domain-containing protein n=1 Tax=Echinostoma caproni TaxID=27848 RepID=A0A183AS59_9TREM|nr:unnamed protein product [Echinostoma caproni]
MMSLCKLTRDDAKIVYSATIVLNEDQHIQYEAGDSIGLLCPNSDTDVKWLISRIDFGVVEHADKPFCVLSVLENKKKKAPPSWLLPDTLVTARFLLTYCCELHIPVTRRITRILADCCTEMDPNVTDPNFPKPEKQSKRLLELSSREGSALFDKYIREPNVTLMDLLASFPACRIPLVQLLDILPRLQPRAYTITNPPERQRSSAQSLSIVFTRVDFTGPTGEEPVGLCRYPYRTHGVCSGWLERVWNCRSPGSDSVSLPGIYGRINLNGFRLPVDRTVPIIMLGAGTGIAPFVCFIEEERRQRLKNSSTKREMWLIYGCRSPLTSLLFPDQLAKALSDGVLSRLCLCFSRYTTPCDGPTIPTCTEAFDTLNTHSCFHPKARYVQNCLLSSGTHENELAQWILSRNATIMVCGEARAMAPAIRAAWSELLGSALVRDTSDPATETEELQGQIYIKRMCDERRYLEDIWT